MSLTSYSFLQAAQLLLLQPAMHAQRWLARVGHFTVCSATWPVNRFLWTVLVKVGYYASSTALFWPSYAKIVLGFPNYATF